MHYSIDQKLEAQMVNPDLENKRLAAPKTNHQLYHPSDLNSINPKK